jgi:hypothetical protein
MRCSGQRLLREWRPLAWARSGCRERSRSRLRPRGLPSLTLSPSPLFDAPQAVKILPRRPSSRPLHQVTESGARRPDQDERRILSWSNDRTLRLGDAATGQQLGPAMKHDGGVRGAVLTKDERRILSWSDDYLHW